MDGYHQGNPDVTYDRLRAMGNNGVQEPVVGYENGQLIGTKRLYADGTFGTGTARPGSARARGAACRRPARRSRKPSSPTSSTTAAPTLTGQNCSSIRTTTSSPTVIPIRSSR